jgi:hypothetical protein
MSAKQNKEFLEVSPAAKLRLFTSEQGLGFAPRGVSIYIRPLTLVVIPNPFTGEGSASHAVTGEKVRDPSSKTIRRI